MECESCCVDAATNSSVNFPTLGIVHKLSIGNLPVEIMELIFEELDSINRKRIERVCKGWQRIVRRVIKKFRTQLTFEIPPSGTYFEQYHYWFNGFRHLGSPQLENLRFKSVQIPDVADTIRSRPMRMSNGLISILSALRGAGTDLATTDIVFKGCTLDCQVLTRHNLPADTKKIRIIHSNIAAAGWFGSSSVYFEELFLDIIGDVPQQIGKLFLAEQGQLTEEESDFLRKLERRITFDAKPDLGRIRRLADRIPRLEWIKYVDGYTWTEALRTIAEGGHVSKHTVGFLKRLYPRIEPLFLA